MKTIFSTACLASALLMLASCGSPKRTPTAPSGVLEFDQASGTWKPATKIVAPPPHQASAPLPVYAEQSEHPSLWKKSLRAVGLGKDKAEAPPPPPSSKAAAKAKADEKPDASVVNRPPARSPIEPKPGHESLWQKMGDLIKKPFNHGSDSSTPPPS